MFFIKILFYLFLRNKFLLKYNYKQKKETVSEHILRL